MKKLFAVCAILSLLTGCAVHTRDGSLVIDPIFGGHRHGHADEGNGGGHGGGRGYFCPPGQAKKGNC